MPSDPPPTPPPPADDRAAERARDWKRLRRFLTRDGFHFGLAVHDDERRRDELVAQLASDAAADGVDLIRVDLATLPQDVVLLKALMEALAAHPAAAGRKRALSVVGLERHLDYLHGGTNSQENTDLLGTANFQRDAFPDRCPVPLVLWGHVLAQPAIARIAPDLWHWRTGSFDLCEGREVEWAERLEQAMPRPEKNWQTLPKEDAKRRIAMLHGLLADGVSGEDTPRPALEKRTRLLLELSDTLRDTGEIVGSREAAEEARGLAERLGDDRLRASALDRIALTLYRTGHLDEALRIRRDDELPVYERLGDVRSKAVTQSKIADILRARGQLDEALRIWRDDVLPVFEQLGDVRATVVTQGQIAGILQVRGQLDEALRIWRDEQLPVYERLGDVRSKAAVQGQIANILRTRGQLDEALRLRRDEQLPVYEQLGDVREKANTHGHIADILQARGQLDEALRIRREDELPVYERLGDVRLIAVTQGQIADILEARGQLDEALRIRREDELPVYERLGDIREKAVAQGKIADILQACGQLDEALGSLRDNVLPVFERLGDVRSKALTQSRIADILQARGQLDEALRIRRHEELPVFERLGDVRSAAVTQGKIAIALMQSDPARHRDEARRLLTKALAAFERMGLPEADAVRGWMKRFGFTEAPPP